MIASPKPTDGPYTVTPARESGPEHGGPGDTGIVAHVDGEPVVIGEMWDEGILPDGRTIALPGRANAIRFTTAGNACLKLSDQELAAGIVAASTKEARD